MNYIAILEQENGCDYTIGCGIKIIQLHSNNLEEAKADLKNILLRDNYLSENCPETLISSAKLYEVSYLINFNIHDLINEKKEEQFIKDMSKQRDEELKLLSKLKAKYEQ